MFYVTVALIQKSLTVARHRLFHFVSITAGCAVVARFVLETNPPYAGVIVSAGHGSCPDRWGGVLVGELACIDAKCHAHMHMFGLGSARSRYEVVIGRYFVLNWNESISIQLHAYMHRCTHARA